MAMTDDVPPLPPELAEPNPGDDAWVDALVERAVTLADEQRIDLSTALQILTAPLDVDDDDEGGPPSARGWRIDGIGTAEWAMRHVAAAEAQIADLEHQANEWQERILAWYQSKTKALHARRAFFAGHLEDYALRCREADPKAKSLVLPSGRVSTLGRSAAVAMVDEGAVLAWAAAELDADRRKAVLKTTTKVVVNELRKVAHVVELVDEAKITATDGTITTWTAEDPAQRRFLVLDLRISGGVIAPYQQEIIRVNS